MKEMSPRERMLTAYRGGKPDRVPITEMWTHVTYRLAGCLCWMHRLKVAEELGWDLHMHLNTVTRPDRGQVNYIYNLGPMMNAQGRSYYEELDDVRVQLTVDRKGPMTYVSRVIDTPAGRLQDRIVVPADDAGYGKMAFPDRPERLIKGRDDLPKIKYLLEVEPPRYQIEDAREIIKHVGDRGLVVGTMYSPLDYLLGEACQTEDLLTMYYDDRELFRDLLATFQEYCLRQTKAYLEIGVQVFVMTWYCPSFSVGWSKRIWEELFLPLLKEQVRLLHEYGAVANYYDDGRMRDVLPYLVDAGVDCAESFVPPPVGNITLKEARQFVGPGMALRGGVDNLYALVLGDRKRIFEEVERAIHDAGENGGYLLSTSDPIPPEAPLENIKHFIEAGKQFGQYG